MAFSVRLEYEAIFDRKEDADLFYTDVISSEGTLNVDPYQPRAILFNSAHEVTEVADPDPVPSEAVPE
jgi:hypothetical protein